MRISIRSRLQIGLLGSLLTWAAGSYADCGGVPGQGICTDVRVTLLYVDPNAAYIQVSGNVAALPCNAAGGLIKLPANTAANFKAMYATLLAAQLADRLVNVRVETTATARSPTSRCRRDSPTGTKYQENRKPPVEVRCTPHHHKANLRALIARAFCTLATARTCSRREWGGFMRRFCGCLSVALLFLAQPAFSVTRDQVLVPENSLSVVNAGHIDGESLNLRTRHCRGKRPISWFPATAAWSCASPARLRRVHWGPRLQTGSSKYPGSSCRRRPMAGFRVTSTALALATTRGRRTARRCRIRRLRLRSGFRAAGTGDRCCC